MIVVYIFSAIGAVFVAIVIVVAAYGIIKPFVKVEDPRLKEWDRRRRGK